MRNGGGVTVRESLGGRPAPVAAQTPRKYPQSDSSDNPVQIVMQRITTNG